MSVHGVYLGESCRQTAREPFFFGFLPLARPVLRKLNSRPWGLQNVGGGTATDFVCFCRAPLWHVVCVAECLSTSPSTGKLRLGALFGSLQYRL